MLREDRDLEIEPGSFAVGEAVLEDEVRLVARAILAVVNCHSIIVDIDLGALQVWIRMSGWVGCS